MPCDICQVLCWVTDIWDPLSNRLYTCPEYVFCTFRSTFSFSTLLRAWEAGLYGLHQWVLFVLSGWIWPIRGISPRHMGRRRGDHLHAATLPRFWSSLLPSAPSSCCSLIHYWSLPFQPLFFSSGFSEKSVALVSCGSPTDTPLITL